MRDPSNNENTSISDSKTVGKHHAMEAFFCSPMLTHEIFDETLWQSSSSSSLTFPNKEVLYWMCSNGESWATSPSRAGQLPLFDGSPRPISIDVSMGFQSYTFTYEMVHVIYMYIYCICICICTYIYIRIYYVYFMLSYYTNKISCI